MAKKTEKKDPYMIDPNEASDLKNAMKTGSKGLICPKCNKSINEKCYVCDEVSRLYNSGEPKNIDIARQKKAKVNFFLNVVLPENPDKSFILEIGRNAGNAIINGIEKKGWVDIANPRAGAGRELTITKEKADGRNHYSVAPVLEKADWDIPDKVLENLPNLDNIIDMLENGELTDDNYMNINTIGMDETLKFRMCPPADGAERFKRMAFVWRHWGVTQEEIDGEVEVDFKAASTDDSSSDAPWEGEAPEEEKATKEKVEPEKEGSDERERCFGDPNLFDEDDKECRECKDFKACKRAVLKKDK